VLNAWLKGSSRALEALRDNALYKSTLPYFYRYFTLTKLHNVQQAINKLYDHQYLYLNYESEDLQVNLVNYTVVHKKHATQYLFLNCQLLTDF